MFERIQPARRINREQDVLVQLEQDEFLLFILTIGDEVCSGD